jgi:glycosyltransferase involved in cell wall biosynthesis
VKISASIIVFNEEDNIRDLCESIKWVDEIVIVDSFSSDRTKEIAAEYTSNIFDHEFKGYKDKHEFADSKTTGDWILWMDADERVTPELRSEIESLKQCDELPDGFEMPRRTWFAGRWIEHSGWYPDHQMRLYRKASSYWDGVAPHETARVKGPVKRLKGHILHHTKRDLSEYHRTIDSYTSFAASALQKSGRSSSGFSMFVNSIAGFSRSYFIKQGFRDGTQGLMIAMFTAYGVFLKYAKLWERNSKSE